MKIYAILATVLSILCGLLPIYIAKTTDQGDELCDPDLYYAAERSCSLLWEPTLLIFSLYFGIAAVFLAVACLIAKVALRLSCRR